MRRELHVFAPPTQSREVLLPRLAEAAQRFAIRGTKLATNPAGDEGGGRNKYLVLKEEVIVDTRV